MSASAVPDPTVEALSTAAPALVPQSAHDWAESHYVAFCDFSDPDASKHVGFGTREATWRDAPTTWGEVADLLAARAVAPDALRERIAEAVGTVADNERDLTSGAPTVALIDRLAAVRALLEDGAQ